MLTQYEPAVDLSDADGFSFSCTWRNTFDRTIVEGTGDDEMCMVFGYAWPVDHSYNAFAQDGGCLLVPTP